MISDAAGDAAGGAGGAASSLASPLATALGALDLPAIPAIAQAAAVMFFAFAGYARVATLGEEVLEPRRTIPRAILTALGAIVVLYLGLGALLALVGPPPTTGGLWGAAPFVTALEAVAAGPVWAIVIRTGAAAAAAGALLALIAGVSRTALGMAREGDLPRALAHVDARRSVPQRAEVAVGLAAIGLVLFVPDVLTAIAASSFGVLLYYAVANASALTQVAPFRLYPKALQVIGLIGCALLVLALPVPTILAGLLLVGLGCVYRLVAVRAG